MSSDQDARIIAHVRHLGSIARTAADSVIASYREVAATESAARADNPETMADVSPNVPRMETVREPLGSEVVILSHLLRTYPTPDSMRRDGQ